MTIAPTSVRDTILITHANPQDNDFARWLAGRLAVAGYKSWVDVRALRGGDDFWDKIEHVLRNEAIKQIVVVSEHIGKQGVKKELALGDVMRRKLDDPEFMVPIRIADIDFGDFPTEILRQNAHDAFPNWAACLEPLFATLDAAGVPKIASPDADQLSMIISAQEEGRKLVTEIPEILYSNWFGLDARPDVWVLDGKGTTAQLNAWSEFTRIPHVLHNGGVIAFSGPVAIEGLDDLAPPLKARASLPFNSVIDGSYPHIFGQRSEARRLIVNLMRQHWDLAMHRSGLLPVDFASGARGWFVPDGLIEKSVKSTLADGHKVDRVLSGKFKALRWHLCLVAQPKLWPEALYRVHANVAVTTDGRATLPGDQLQRMRLRLTRSWFNDKWRDMLLAAMSWLANGDETLDLSATGERLAIRSLPMTFDFEVSFSAVEDRRGEEDATGQITLSEDFESAFDADDAVEEPAA